MKIKFKHDSVGRLWQGVGKEKCRRLWQGVGKEKCRGSGLFLNLGFFAIDWYRALRMLAFYFWKWNIEVKF